MTEIPNEHPGADARRTAASGDWFYEQDGLTVGPFTEADLQQLLAVGMITGTTSVVGPNGQRLHAAEAASAKPVLPEPAIPAVPPPPPPPAVVPDSSHNPAWNPVLIAWLGLPFSPAWAGVMAALNGRRLRPDQPLLRPVLIGLGAAAGWLLLSTFVINFWLLNVAIYVGALWFVWNSDLREQAEIWNRHEQNSESWTVPALSGVPLMLIVTFALLVLPLQPLTPTEVCEQFMRATSLSQAKKVTTRQLWPALAAIWEMDPADARITSYELSGTEPGPQDQNRYRVTYKIEVDLGRSTEFVTGVFEMVRDGSWKIEEIRYKNPYWDWGRDSVRLSECYSRMLRVGHSGRAIAGGKPGQTYTTPGIQPTGPLRRDYSFRNYGQ